jgi:hypothetical protein
MQLGALTFVPRLRRPLEALDLGLALLQAHLGPIMALWALQTGILLALLLPFNLAHPLRALAWLWWLKPWLGRGVVFVLSRKVFGQEAGVLDFLVRWREVHRRGVPASLLWRRFSPFRSVTLPVFMLEGLGGRPYRQRCALFHRHGQGETILLNVTGLLCTALVFLGALGLLQAMMAPGLQVDLWELLTGDPPLWYSWLLLGLGLAALAVTEPFFAAAGFALYLNRRTQLEGWDLELAFRRLRSRLAPTALLLLLACLGGPALRAQVPAGVHAAAPAAPLRPDAPARARATRILKEDPAFHDVIHTSHREYRPTGREPRWLRTLLDRLFAPDAQPGRPVREPGPDPTWFMEILAILGKAVLVGLGVGLLLWLIVRYHNRAVRQRAARETWEAPEAIAGLDLRPETLPADVPARARELFRQGEVRAALALLYRGALAELVHGRGLDLPPGATEGECLRAARRTGGDVEGFARLTRAWQRAAYKADLPGEEPFEALCAEWPSAFGRRP